MHLGICYGLIKDQIESNLHHTRGITLKRVTSGRTHLRELAPGLPSSEEMWQNFRI